MADIRITPGSGSIQFSGSVSEDVISLNYTGSAVQFNTGSTNLIHISSSGFVGIGTVTNPGQLKLYVSGGDAYFSDSVYVGTNAFGIGKVYFGPTPLLYVTGDANINELRAKSQFGSVILEGNNSNTIEVSSNGLEYKRSGATFFQVDANQLTYSVVPGSTFTVDSVGSITSTVVFGGQFTLNSGFVGGGIERSFNIKPQNGFDIYTGSVQLLGIKETGNVQVGSLDNPNSVLEVTGSIQVSGSIYTNGTNIQTLSIAYAIALG